VTRHTQIITETDMAWAELERIQSRPEPKPATPAPQGVVYYVALTPEQTAIYDHLKRDRRARIGRRANGSTLKRFIRRAIREAR
jgi:hypothetical protein